MKFKKLYYLKKLYIKNIEDYKNLYINKKINKIDYINNYTLLINKIDIINKKLLTTKNY